MCKSCGKEFDVYQDDPTYQCDRWDGLCSEDCASAHYGQLAIRSIPAPWVKLRAPTEQSNLSKKLGNRESLANISAARQRRLDEVRELFEAGVSPTEIAKQLGHHGVAVYADLRALGIDPKQSRSAVQATEAREQLLERIKQLVDEGKQYLEIAPLVGLSAEMVGYHARKNFKIDGRKRQASRRKQPCRNKE